MKYIYTECAECENGMGTKYAMFTRRHIHCCGFSSSVQPFENFILFYERVIYSFHIRVVFFALRFFLYRFSFSSTYMYQDGKVIQIQNQIILLAIKFISKILEKLKKFAREYSTSSNVLFF